MPRKDYDYLKDRFGEFIKSLTTRDISDLKKYIEPEIKCYCSVYGREYADCGIHTIFGVENFIKDFPKTDVFHSKIYNYICRFNDSEAQQFAEVVILCANKKEDKYQTFEATIHFLNHWNKMGDNWMLNEMRIEFDKHFCDIPEVEEFYYFDNPRVGYHEGIRYPIVNAEFDSPWVRIPKSEDVLTEEEKIYHVFCRYAFAIDSISFQLMPDILDENVLSTMPRNDTMNKREWVTQLKYNRSRDRMWSHTGKMADLKINGDNASVTFYRMSGHRQRTHEYEYNDHNINIQHACAKYVMEMKKNKKGEWKISRDTYFLGFVELGKFDDDPYGQVFSK